MKKLLSFLVAGIAALGLASCSGDLHNEFDPTSELAKALFDTSIKIEDFDTFELCGIMTGWNNNAETNIQFVENEEDGTWEADFLSTEDDDQGFCFITKTGKWDDYQIGGESMEAGTLPDGVKFSSKAGGGKHEDAILSGLKKKTFYKMIVDGSSGKYVVSIEKSTATPFYLQGYFLRTSENGGAATGATVLGTPILDKKTYNVTYSYEFAFDSSYTPASSIDVTDSTTQIGFKLTKGASEIGYYDGVFTVGTTKDAVKLTLESESSKVATHNDNLIKGLVDGKKYILTIKTTPEKDVTLEVSESPYINIVGAKIVNLDTTVFTDGTFIVLNGEWCNNWAGAWNNTSAYGGTVSNGTLECSWTAIQIFDTEYAHTSVGCDNTGSPDWNNKRLAKKYNVDDGNATLKVETLDNGDYIIYADMEGIEPGDEIEWKFVKKN